MINGSFDEFLAALRRQATRDTYANALRRWDRWLGDREPDRALAQRWIDSLTQDGLKDNTISTYANAVRRYFRWAKGERVLIESPSVEVQGAQYHPVELIRRMLDLADPLEKAVAGVMFDTACRLSEILNLRRRDIEWDNEVIWVTRKGGHREDVSITDRGLELLRDWLATRQGNPQLVFLPYIAGDSQKAKLQAIRAKLQRIARRAGIRNFKPHHLRHSRAADWLKDGVPLYRVSELMGHRSVEVTAKIYGKLLPEERQEFAKRGSRI